jgi:prevent-host-death family protein
MPTVNMLEAKSNLSELVRAVESGEQEEIIIARNGVPAARLVPLKKKSRVRLGVAEGKYVIPDNIDADNDLIAEMFGVGPEK